MACSCTNIDLDREALNAAIEGDQVPTWIHVARAELKVWCREHGWQIREEHVAQGLCEAFVLSRDTETQVSHFCAVKGRHDVLMRGHKHRLCGTHLRALQNMAFDPPRGAESKAEWWTREVWRWA